MAKVKLKFKGYRDAEVAQRFYTWVVDGGLEDGIIDTLSDEEISVEGISDFDNDKLTLTIKSIKESAS